MGGEAVSKQGLELTKGISSKSIAHLGRQIEAVLTMHQYLGEIFPGMFTTDEKERYLKIMA